MPRWESNPSPSTIQYLRRILNSVTSLANTLKTWCPTTESNCHHRITKPVYCHCTSRANVGSTTRTRRLTVCCHTRRLPWNKIWCWIPGSNWAPTAYKAVALPNELIQRVSYLTNIIHMREIVVNLSHVYYDNNILLCFGTPVSK